MVFPELALTGYPPEDLLLKTHFLTPRRRRARGARRGGARTSSRSSASRSAADDVYNAAAVLADGRVAAVYRKMFLPNYGVFDEQRYFQAGNEPAMIEVNGVAIGLTICEDIWEPGPPATTEALAGRAGDREPLGLAVPRGQGRASASRCSSSARATTSRRSSSATPSAARTSWSSTATASSFDQDGEIIARAPQFEEELPRAARRPRRRVAARLQRRAPPRGGPARACAPDDAPAEHLGSFERARGRREHRSAGRWRAARRQGARRSTARWCTGVRDYVEKNGFERVVFGALRRDRLGAGGADRRRRARSRRA